MHTGPETPSLDQLAEFIKAKGQNVERAYWLELFDKKGGVRRDLTLSESALDARLERMAKVVERATRKSGRFSREYYQAQDAMREKHNYGEAQAYYVALCDDTGKVISGGADIEVENAWYPLSGFAWRREQAFEVTQQDWDEACVYLEGIDYALQWEDEESGDLRKLRELIILSCFVTTGGANDSGIYNPGAAYFRDWKEAHALFDFVAAAQKRFPDPQALSECAVNAPARAAPAM